MDSQEPVDTAAVQRKSVRLYSSKRTSHQQAVSLVIDRMLSLTRKVLAILGAKSKKGKTQLVEDTNFQGVSVRRLCSAANAQSLY